MTDHKTWRSRIFSWTLYLLSFIVLSSSIYVVFGSVIQAKLLESYKPKIDQFTLIENQKSDEKANYDWANVSNTNVGNTLKSRITGTNKPVAIMTQPKAKVSVTVVNGVSNDDLNLSAGTTRPDTKIGQDNYVLAAHHVPRNDWALFSGIYYFGEPGQKIYITDLEKVYEYEVTDIRFVKSTDVYVTEKNNYKDEKYASEFKIVPGQPMFTAILCDATGTDQRMIETGTLTNTYNFNDDDIPIEAIEGFEKAANFDWKRG